MDDDLSLYGISLCDDDMFRGVFGRRGSETILRGLLNAVLRNAGEPTVESLEIVNPQQPQEARGQKETILDVKARDVDGRVFDVEIQVASREFFRERILYYWARNYGVLLEEGISYGELRPAVGVIFTKFPIYRKNEDVLFDTFQIVSKRFPNRLYSEHLKLHFVVVPDDAESARQRFETSELVDWLKTLNYPKHTSEEEMSNILTENPAIGETLEKTREFLATPEGRAYLEGRRKFLLDQQWIQNSIRKESREAGLKEGREAGREAGLKEGREEGREEGAKRSLSLGIVDVLRRRFGDSAEEISVESLGDASSDDLRRLLIVAATCSDVDEFLSAVS